MLRVVVVALSFMSMLQLHAYAMERTVALPYQFGNGATGGTSVYIPKCAENQPVTVKNGFLVCASINCPEGQFLTASSNTLVCKEITLTTVPHIVTIALGSVGGWRIKLDVDLINGTVQDLSSSLHSSEWKYSISGDIANTGSCVLLSSNIYSNLSFSGGQTDTTVNLEVLQYPSQANNYHAILQITDQGANESPYSDGWRLEGSFSFLVNP